MNHYLALLPATLPSDTISWVLIAVQVLLILFVIVFGIFLRRPRQDGLINPLAATDQPGRLTRILVCCGGVHPADLEGLGQGAYFRHAVCGTMLFVASGMAYFGLLTWVSQFAGIGLLSGHFIAAIGALIVFALDWGIVSSLSHASGGRGWFFALLRVTLAVTLGWFIAKPYLVVIYKGEIEQMQRDKKEEKILALTSKANAQREQVAGQTTPVLEHYKQMGDMLQKKTDELVERRKERQKAFVELDAKRIHENEGLNGRPKGQGDFYNFYNTESAKVQKELEQLDKEERALEQERGDLTMEKQKVINKALSDPHVETAAKALDGIMEETSQAKADSLGRQLDLLHEYIAAGGNDRKWDYWLFHLLLILLDTAPVMTKLFMYRQDFKLAAGLREHRLEVKLQAERTHAPAFAERTATARHMRELRDEMLAGLVTDADHIYQVTAHIILRGQQVRLEVERAFLANRRASLFGKAVKAEELEKALAPLDRVQQDLEDRLHRVLSEAHEPEETSTAKPKPSYPPQDGVGLN